MHKVKNEGTKTEVLSQEILKMKYESPITYYSWDMAYVKVFKKYVKLQGQGHEGTTGPWATSLTWVTLAYIEI
jgi:hypothetical protein